MYASANSCQWSKAPLRPNGYRIEIPRHPSAGRSTALVMTRGLTTILLFDAPDQALAKIEIWGMGQSLAAQLLESLPIKLYSSSSIALAAFGGADAAAYVAEHEPGTWTLFL